MAEGLTFDADGQSRGMYQEVEEYEGNLALSMKNHAQARERAQKYTLMLEDVKRWAKRMNSSLRGGQGWPPFEDTFSLDTNVELIKYFENLEHTMERFFGPLQQYPQRSKKRGPDARDVPAIQGNCRIQVTDARPGSGTPHEND